MVLARLISRSASWLRRLGRPPGTSPVEAAVRTRPASAAAGAPTGWHGARDRTAPADPDAVVRAFIADYAAWNDRAWADCAEGAAADDRQVNQAYREAVGHHLAAGVSTLPAAFDGESLHAPEREAVVDVQVVGALAQVRTRVAPRHGERHRVFEYRLRLQGGRWGLEAVDELDAAGGRVSTL